MQLKEVFYILLPVIVNASCANNTGANLAPGKIKNSSPINCYRYANSGDTITLKIIHIGESITGTLVYKMPRKNTSKGTIQGGMTGDMLIVRYTPFADSSVIQQKLFKLTEKYFVEGHGDTIQEDGWVRYKNTNDLNFIDTIRLNEINCE